MAATVAALSPRLITAVHPDPAGLLRAAAAGLARRAEDLWEDDAEAAMEDLGAALEALGGLFLEDGAMHALQYLGKRGDEDVMAACHKAGWEMREAAGPLAQALAARRR